jgi:NADH-quinone oxidoreductase subunit J
MTAEAFVFLIVAVVTLGSALMVVTARELINMALWLILTLFGIAIIFAMLSAGFLAVAQVVVYIGAIAILIIFAIMLTRRISQEKSPRYNTNWRWGLLIAVLLFAGLLFVLSSWSGITTTAPQLDSRYSVASLGEALVDPGGFLLPFELASILLLAALVGSIYVAWERRSG